MYSFFLQILRVYSAYFHSHFIIQYFFQFVYKNHKKSCLFFGCSYEGRREAVKDLIGIDMKVPILIEESRNIIFFPTNSCVKRNSIWISYQNLLKYTKFNEFSTVLYFCNKRKIKVDVKHNLIDNQVIRCLKLDTILSKRKMIIKD